MSRSIHIVQLSYDDNVFDARAARDSRVRHIGYARALRALHPGVRLTMVVLTERPGLRRERIGNLELLPCRFVRRRQLHRLYRYLGALHRSRPISLLTTQDVHGPAWAGLAFARRAGIPIVGLIHYDITQFNPVRGLSGLGPWLYERLVRRTLRYYHGLRVVNSTASRFLRALGYRGRIEVAPVPVTVFEPTGGEDPWPWPADDALRVLFVGRLESVKNLDCWLRTAQRAVRAGAALRFAIVGAGSEGGRLRRRSRELGIADRVVFVGALPPPEVARWYRHSHVLLLTSHSEGFGRVVVEAMHYGVVPVCTDTAGTRDIVVHGSTGCLSRNDPDELARCLVQLARDRRRLAALSRAARERAASHFAPERMRSAWLQFLLSFVSEASAPAPSRLRRC